MARFSYGGAILSGLPSSYRVKFTALTAAGAPVAALAGVLVVRRAKNGEVPSALITPTITEVDAVNFIGLYELRLAAVDVDTPGPLALKLTGGTMEELHLLVSILPREAVLSA